MLKDKEEAHFMVEQLVKKKGKHGNSVEDIREMFHLGKQKDPKFGALKHKHAKPHHLEEKEAKKRPPLPLKQGKATAPGVSDVPPEGLERKEKAEQYARKRRGRDRRQSRAPL